MTWLDLQEDILEEFAEAQHFGLPYVEQVLTKLLRRREYQREYQRLYRRRPEQKEKRQAYLSQPDVKARVRDQAKERLLDPKKRARRNESNRRFMKEYCARPEVKARRKAYLVAYYARKKEQGK